MIRLILLFLISLNAYAVSIWNSDIPETVDSNDPASVELGLRFMSDNDGQVTGVKFYKSAVNTGVHVGSLWDSAGNQLATVAFANETASGWQSATFAQPVTINANTEYVISYHTNVGHYSADTGYFTSEVNSAPLHGINSVYMYDANSVFPNQTFGNTNYWVDVDFTVSNTPPPPPPVLGNIHLKSYPNASTGYFQYRINGGPVLQLSGGDAYTASNFYDPHFDAVLDGQYIDSVVPNVLQTDIIEARYCALDVGGDYVLHPDGSPLCSDWTAAQHGEITFVTVPPSTPSVVCSMPTP